MAAGAVALGAVGFADDCFGLQALPRLGLQLLVPLTVGLLVIDQGDNRVLGVAAVTAAVIAAGYVNAFNFMDGINAISAVHAAIGGVFLASVAHDIGESSLRGAGFAIAGAAVGFLPFNALRARIFLGDVGSYFVGFWLVAVAMLLVAEGVASAVILGPFLLYIGDTGSTLLRRARAGAPLFTAHRDHAYQRLVQYGWSHAAVAGLSGAVSASCAITTYSVLGSSIPAQALALAGCVLLVAAFLVLPSVLEGST